MKLPSARESRASVACQYRAAACAEMLCANLVCMWLMFNTLKVAQAEKQIYPERFGKLSNFHTSPGAGTGEVAGGGAPRGGGGTQKTAGRMAGGREDRRNE